MFNYGMEEEKSPEIVSDQQVAGSSPKTDIVYFRPPFYQRVLANLIDALIMIFVFLSVFLGVREIVKNTPNYKAKQQQLSEIRLNSGVYEYDDNNVLRDIITVLNSDKGQTAKSRSVRAKKAIEQFLTYASEVASEEDYKYIVNDYRSFRLDESLKIQNIPMFIVDENDEVVENPELVEGIESVSSNIYTTYYEKAYKVYIDNKVQAFLTTSIPHYKEIISYQTNMLLWVELLGSYCVAGLIAYLPPYFIFKRGRKTFGKAIYGIGLVDRDCLSPKIGRSLARFSIFYFGELILSVFSFGLPFILSFSLMAFSKNKQGFPDYMLGLQEVDAKRTKIYFNFQEVELDNTSTYKKPVDFRTRNYD